LSCMVHLIGLGEQRHAGYWQGNLKEREIFKVPRTDGTRNEQIRGAKKFCAVALNICESSAWNLLHVIFLAPRIFRWVVDIWEICASLNMVIILNWDLNK